MQQYTAYNVCTYEAVVPMAQNMWKYTAYNILMMCDTQENCITIYNTMLSQYDIYHDVSTIM